MKTTLINVYEYRSDFIDFVGEEETAELLSFEGKKVEVLCEATDGYWIIKLPNGTVFDNVGWIHLDGFTYDSHEEIVTTRTIVHVAR